MLLHHRNTLEGVIHVCLLRDMKRCYCIFCVQELKDTLSQRVRLCLWREITVKKKRCTNLLEILLVICGREHKQPHSHTCTQNANSSSFIFIQHFLVSGKNVTRGVVKNLHLGLSLCKLEAAATQNWTVMTQEYGSMQILRKQQIAKIQKSTVIYSTHLSNP